VFFSCDVATNVTVEEFSSDSVVSVFAYCARIGNRAFS